ncbi:MAG: VWA domain-containing protein [Phycisphaerae bacterium]|jgi:Mg-chelatase subunit ChlD
MLFVHPKWLWLLVLIVPLVAAHVSHRFGLGGLRAVAVVVTRAAVFALLVVALARPVVERGPAGPTTVVIADVSDSVSADDQSRIAARIEGLRPFRPGHEVFKVVAFDEVAREVALDGERLTPARLRGSASSGDAGAATTRPVRPGSVLAEALDLAGALIPEGAPGRVVLFSDGLQTGGDARLAAHRLARRRIALEAHAVGAERTDDVILKRVSLPASASAGAAVTLGAEIESARPGPARLVIRRTGDGALTTREIELRPGIQVVETTLSLEKEGPAEYQVRVEAAGDARPDNNALAAAVEVAPPRTVRVVENAENTPAAAALRAALGESAKVIAMTPADLAASPPAADPADLLVIADVPAEDIPAHVQQRLRDAVAAGQGLLVTGGRQSFGPGGYASGPLAEVLPVRSSQEVERRDPSTTLVIIIDTSGSMTGTRVNLAKEVARLALSRLAPHDKAGIVEFYGSKRWAAPIQPASNAIDIQRALNRLSAGGGTVILPAIEEAYYALQNVRTRTKHVLVLTDGGVESGPFETLIRKMADRGITVSTVMVGPGVHSGFLASMAQWGRGRFYSAPDRFNLPEVIVKQPDNSMMTPFIEQPSRLSRDFDDPILSGVDVSAAPPLAGYVETQPRPTADVLLVSGLGHPVLARWRFGLGRVAAFTSQLGGEWTADLAGWPEYPRIMANLVRSLHGPDPATALRIEPVHAPAGVEIRIDNVLTGSGDAFSPVELAATDSSGAARRWTLDPVLPNAWNVRLEGLAPGTYRLAAKTADGRLSGAAGLVVPPLREVTALRPDVDLLETIAAAKPAGDAGMTPVRTASARVIELAPLLIAVALAVVPLNVLIRRWPGRWPRGVVPTVTVMAMLLFGASTRSALAQAAPRRTVVPRGALQQRLNPALRAAATRPAAGSRPAGSAARATTARRPVARQNEPRGLAPREIEAIEACLKAADPAEADRLFAAACKRVNEQDGRLDALLAYLKDEAHKHERGEFILARAARAAGDFNLARKTLSELTGTPEADAGVFGELAQVEELLGNDNDALEALDVALARGPGPEQLFALRVRKALILYDLGKRAEAGALLEELAGESDEPAGKKFCAHLAALNNDYELALKLLVVSGHGPGDFQEHLFRGLFYLRLNRPADALPEFEQAYREAPLSRDRRFALERIVTAARRAGTLSRLADAWLADPDLPADRLSALATILRELGRTDDALGLLDRPARTAEHKALLESSDFQREVIAAALSAGRSARAEAIYQDLLARQPDQMEWRISLARLKLLDNRREEAEALLREALAKISAPNALMQLAHAARQLSLDEVALAAVNKAAAEGVTFKVLALLFEADLARTHGEADLALELVHKAIPVAQEDPRALQLVSDALDRHGDKVESLNLARQIYERTRTEDTLLRMAWLLEENKRLEEAYGLWLELWRNTQAPARLKQAQERVLDLAARLGKLADLAIDIEERLSQDKASDKELELLVEIYSTSHDAVSAAEILQTLATRSGRQVDMLVRLARVYLNCEQFGRCDATLRKLAQIDPAHAADYYEQIAIVALERRQPEQATAALAELAAHAGDNEIVDEFSAGVLDMTGQHDAAAAAYGRVYARHPDRIESLLLWGNAMRSAGRVDLAVARFQNLVEEAVEDDLFTVAVDGLLNMAARPPVMKAALRRVYARIAAGPQKVFLYQLAADLLEAAGNKTATTDMLERSVVVGGERRGPILRELMDVAKADGRLEVMIDFGRSLLALGDEVPPQVFLDLGEALLKQGDPALAERVFERASVDGDFATIRQRVAEYYEDAGRPAEADRILRELLVGEPDNVPLLIRSGALCEQLGDGERAFEQCYRAADLLLRRLPSNLRDIAATQPVQEVARPGFARFYMPGNNVSEMSRYFESAGNGLLNAARTDALRERLGRDLRRRLDEELARLEKAKGFAATLADNPRLAALAKFHRKAAFALHDPDGADAFDRRLLERYPEDKALRTAVVRERLDWGLYARARSFADDGQDAARMPTELLVAAFLAEEARLDEAIEKKQVQPALAARLVPGLIMLGRSDQARRVLAEVRTGQRFELGETAFTFLLAAAALEDAAQIARWREYWLDMCLNVARGPATPPPATAEAATTGAYVFRPPRRSKGVLVSQYLERYIRCMWHRLADADRAALVERVAAIAAEMEGADRLAVEQVRMKLCQAVGRPFDGFEALAEGVARDANAPLELVMRVLEATPPERRPARVKTMIEARAAGARRAFIGSLAGRLSFKPDAAFLEVCAELFKAPAAARPDQASVYAMSRAQWNRNRRYPELGTMIGEQLLNESPNDPRVMTDVAVMRQTAGNRDEAAMLAREAIDNLLKVRALTYAHPEMIATCARILGDQDRQDLLDYLSVQFEVEPPTAMQRFIHGKLLEAAGRTGESLAALEAAYRLDEGNYLYSRELTAAFKAAGRTVQLARVLSSRPVKTSPLAAYEWRTLADAWLTLWRPTEAKAAFRNDSTLYAAVDAMRLAHLLGRFDEVQTTFRRFMTRSREDGRLYVPLWPEGATPGGMIAYLERERVPAAQRQRMFDALADLPFAEDDYRGLLAAAGPERRDLQGLISGLRRAVMVRKTLPRLLDELAAVHARNALNFKDRLLILAVAEEAPGALPDLLLAAIDGLLLNTDPNDTATLESLAKVYQERGQAARAEAIRRWTSVRAADSVRAAPAYDYTNPQLALMISLRIAGGSAPSVVRAGPGGAVHAPTPVDPLSEEYEAGRIDKLIEAGDATALAGYADGVRRRMEEEDGGGPFRELQAALARAAAVLGQFTVFEENARAALEPLGTENVTGMQFDPGRLLPPAAKLPEPGRYIDHIVSLLAEPSQTGDPGPAPAVRQLSLLARWCVENGLKDKALEVIAAARKRAGELGDHWLWIADAARMAGDERQALEIEIQALEGEVLPILRAARVLEAVEAQRGPQAADALAERAAAYSDHPEVLRRAIRKARRAGDEAAQSAYAARLAAVSPS